MQETKVDFFFSLYIKFLKSKQLGSYGLRNVMMGLTTEISDFISRILSPSYFFPYKL